MDFPKYIIRVMMNNKLVATFKTFCSIDQENEWKIDATLHIVYIWS